MGPKWAQQKGKLHVARPCRYGFEAQSAETKEVFGNFVLDSDARAVTERCSGVRKQLFVFGVLFGVRF